MGTDPLDEIDRIIDGRAAAKAGADRLVEEQKRGEADCKVLVKRPNGRSGFAESEECVSLDSMTPARIQHTVIEATRARFGAPTSL